MRSLLIGGALRMGHERARGGLGAGESCVRLRFVCGARPVRGRADMR